MTAEVDAIKRQTPSTEFQIGIKPRSIRSGKEKSSLNFSAKILHIEYQGYNKVVNVDMTGTVLRILTNEKLKKSYGDALDVNFAKKDTFLFNRDDGNRIRY